MSTCCDGKHLTYGEHLRSKRLQIGNLGNGYNKNFDRKLALYADARRQGVQPDGTGVGQVTRAMRISEETGVAYNANPQ